MMTFDDVIQPSQIKQHLTIPFQVPVGTRQLDIVFEYNPRQVDGRNNLLTLTLFDPERMRGEGHRGASRKTITLTADSASPGYLAGELPAGDWKLVINTHMVLVPISYHLEIGFADEASAVPDAHFTSSTTAPRGTGWYRGDLHAHTIHSDGRWDVPDLVAYSRSQHLDFMTLSDHNTVSGLPYLNSLGGDDLLTMGGMELTTYYGHCLALGVHEWIDWRVTPERQMSDIVEEVTDKGGLFIIAHPMAMGDPVCTGCDWQYADVMPGAARRVEIWNTPWNDGESRNELALELWYRWLNEGYRMVATAGSDIHGAPSADVVYGRDVVYAAELGEKAILDAVRQGHLYLSTGLTLDLQAKAPDGSSGMMGDCLNASNVHLTLRWSDAPEGTRLRWIANGQVQAEMPCAVSGSAELDVKDKTWALAEFCSPDNLLLAVTNPIYLGNGWR